MRHSYHITDQTRKAIKDHVSEIASEMNVKTQQLYAYLSEAQTDPYSKFRLLYRAVCRVNPDGARLYLNDLVAIHETETQKQTRQSESGDIGREFVERLKELPRDIQRKECMDVIQVACEALKNLEDMGTVEKFGRKRAS